MRQQIAELTEGFTDALVALVSAEVAKVTDTLLGTLGTASATATRRRAPARKAKPLAHANGVAPKSGKGGKVRKPKAGKRSPGQKRSPEEIEHTKGQLAAFIKSNPGKRAEEIQSATGLTTKELALPLKILIAEKAIEHEGEARGRRYFAR